MRKTYKDQLKTFIENALIEDIGDGDHSSLSCIPSASRGIAKLLVKENGIIAGISIARAIFHHVDPNLVFKQIFQDGDSVKPQDIVFQVQGKIRSILLSERFVLNVMQRMSGIATLTKQYVGKLQGLKTKLLDTRKTTPGMRFLEKEAVCIGGGENHRMGLFDMIMLKDNHIDFAGGIENAINKARTYLQKSGKNLDIEIEARNLDDVHKIIRVGGVQRIMLDNFSIPDTRKAVEIIAGKFETESSGDITLKNVREYAKCGVDYISVGALTHQIKSLDLSLKAIV